MKTNLIGIMKKHLGLSVTPCDSPELADSHTPRGHNCGG
jgi:hypothetical protein